MNDNGYVKITLQIVHHFLLQGKIWVVAFVNGVPSVWNEEDIKDAPRLVDI